MHARRTASRGTSAARATASTMTPSCAPWRSSPVSSATRKRCSGSVARAKSAPSASRRAACEPGPAIAPIASHAASTSLSASVASRRRRGQVAQRAVADPDLALAQLAREVGDARSPPRRAPCAAASRPGARSSPLRAGVARTASEVAVSSASSTAPSWQPATQRARAPTRQDMFQARWLSSAAAVSSAHDDWVGAGRRHEALEAGGPAPGAGGAPRAAPRRRAARPAAGHAAGRRRHVLVVPRAGAGDRRRARRSGPHRGPQRLPAPGRRRPHPHGRASTPARSPGSGSARCATATARASRAATSPMAVRSATPWSAASAWTTCSPSIRGRRRAGRSRGRHHRGPARRAVGCHERSEPWAVGMRWSYYRPSGGPARPSGHARLRRGGPPGCAAQTEGPSDNATARRCGAFSARRAAGGCVAAAGGGAPRRRARVASPGRR